MPVERPTFSESWYRVAQLHPRLRSTVQIYRQRFRGQMWHVVQDPASNQFFRLNEVGYHFVGLLDGRRTVAEVWQVCNDQLGDDAPTQGEVIQLLGQLYTSNLLHADLPPDAESLFRRYHKRVTREVQGYLMNLLFIRIPLLDPDHFLDRWLAVFGSVFSLPGLVLWVGLIGAGLYSIAGRGGDLVNRALGVLDVGNLPLLYAALVLIKVCHEFGHAFACKKFGRKTGSGGEVHVMGVMFLVFTPLPYVDASSAWAFRQKWRRAIVGMAGMLVELAVAASAAVIWANTAQGTPLNALTYNMMFIAGVSTILFNGNPLLRYDGYYILSDLLEIPNLAQRSKGYIYYLVRRYAWGVKRARSTAHTPGERPWLAFYAIASTAYRVTVCVAILLFVADKFFLIGVVLAALAVFSWVLVPLGKFVHYLATSGELERVRPRAVGSTLLVVVLAFAGVGAIPAPDRFRIDGVVEPVRFAVVHVQADGFVRRVVARSGVRVRPGDVLLAAENRALQARHDGLIAQRRAWLTEKRLAESLDERAEAQAIAEKIEAVEEEIREVEVDLDALELKAGVDGEWIAPDIERVLGSYLKTGDRVGMIASTDDLLVRALVGQDRAGSLHRQIEKQANAAFRALDLRLPGAAGIRAGETGVLSIPAFPGRKLPFAVERLDRGPREKIAALLRVRLGERVDWARLGHRGSATVVLGGRPAFEAVPFDVVPVDVLRVELCVKGRPDLRHKGTIVKIQDAGTENLPSAALGYLAGGSIQTEAADERGTKATERFFEVRVLPDSSRGLHSGQVVVVRTALPRKPLAVQWYTAILRLFQRRFQI